LADCPLEVEWPTGRAAPNERNSAIQPIFGRYPADGSIYKLRLFVPGGASAVHCRLFYPEVP
jgi:hypothetical protein